MNVPKLRFKEFTGKWEEKRLGEICNINPKLINLPNDFIYIDLESVVNGKLLYENKINKNDAPSRAKRKILKGDILYQTVRPYQMNNYYCVIENKDVVASTGYAQLRGKDNNQKYIYQYLYYNKFLNKIMLRCTGTSYPAINMSNLSNIKIFLPSLEEQEKIADLLSTFGEKIEIQKQILENMENMTKGLMQKIFSREIRFKDSDGNDFPMWEEKQLGEIGEIKTSSVDKIIKENEQIVSLVNYMDVYKHKTITSKNCYELMTTSAKENQIKVNNLEKGDILFTPSSETPNDIGHSIVIFEDLENTLYSYHLIRFRPKKKVLNISFSHYCCNIENILQQFVKLSQGITRYTLTINGFKKVIIFYPIDLKEQEKIAELLTNIDEKIQIQKKIIEHTERLKKGLLQQMFC